MVSLYSLENLYNQGILDYVPAELANSTNVSSLAGMQNPYLNMAAQGQLYQTAGMKPDGFYKENAGYIGAHNKNNIDEIEMNRYGGINGNILINNPQIEEKALNGGFGRIGEAVSNTPGIVKGLIAGVIIIGTTLLCFKKGKKVPVKTQEKGTNILSKLKFWKK